MDENLRNKVKEAAKEYFGAVSIQNRQKEYIPASGKFLDWNDLSYMIDATLDMWLTSGRFNKEFEEKFAKYLNVKYALSTNSGSSANLLALSALTSPKLKEKALKKGDEVITVAAGFPTTINPIFQNGLIPVFVDVEIGSYNISIEKIEEAISKKTKAIFIAHTLGYPFDLDNVLNLAKKYNLWVIEDSCDALGAEYKGQKTGSFGDIGTFSFYPAHHITMGEGGAVVTNNPELHKILLSFRDWGRDCICPPGVDNVCKKRFSRQFGNLPFGYDHKYTYSNIGYNLKITDWQAALGVSQLDKIEDFIEKRTKNAEFLYSRLQELNEFLMLPEIEDNVKPSWFGFLISVKKNAPFTKNELVQYLENNGIGTRQLFAGNILRQPMITENDVDFRIGNSKIINSKELNDKYYNLLSNTEFIMNSTFWTGVYPMLNEEDMIKISDTIAEFCDMKAKTLCK